MAAQSPEEINELFVKYMREGDLDSVARLYDPAAVFRTASGELRNGPEAIREELAIPDDREG